MFIYLPHSTFMKGRNKKITYVSGVSTHDGINWPVHEDISVSMRYVMRFGKSLALTAVLTKTENLFLMFLTEEMGDDNLFKYSAELRKRFNLYMSSLLDKDQPFSERTMKNCLEKLKEEQALISTGKRGWYYVNPLYFAKCLIERDRLIKKLAEQKLLKNDGKH